MRLRFEALLVVALAAISCVGAADVQAQHQQQHRRQQQHHRRQVDAAVGGAAVSDDNDVYVDDQGSLVRSNSHVAGGLQQEPLRQYAVEYEDPNYNFAYAVRDDLQGNFQAAREARQGQRTRGAYRVLQPDGVTRTVVYNVNGDQGFDADVSYARGAVQGRSSRPKRGRGNLQQPIQVEESSSFVKVGSDGSQVEEVVEFIPYPPGSPQRPMNFFPAFAPAPEEDIQYFTPSEAVKFTLEDVIRKEENPEQQQETETSVLVPLFDEDANEAAEDLNDPPADPAENPFEGSLVKLDEVQEEQKADKPKVQSHEVAAENNKAEGGDKVPLVIKHLTPLSAPLFQQYRQKLPVVDLSHLKFGPAVTGPLIAAHLHQKKLEHQQRQQELNRQKSEGPARHNELLEQRNKQKRQLPNHQAKPNIARQATVHVPSFAAPLANFGQFGFPQQQGPQPGFNRFGGQQVPRQQAFNFQQGPQQQFPNPALLFGANGFPGFNFQPAALQQFKVGNQDKKKVGEDENALEPELQDIVDGNEDDYEVKTVSTVKDALKLLKEEGVDGAIFQVQAEPGDDPKKLLKQVKSQLKGEQKQKKASQQPQGVNPFAAVQSFNALAQQSFPIELLNAAQGQQGQGQGLPFGQTQQRPGAQLPVNFGAQQQQFPGFPQPQFGQGPPASFLPQGLPLQQGEVNQFGPQQSQFQPGPEGPNFENFPGQQGSPQGLPEGVQQPGFPGAGRPFSGPVRNRRPGAGRGNQGQPGSPFPRQNRPVRNTNTRPTRSRPVRDALANIPNTLRGLLPGFNRAQRARDNQEEIDEAEAARSIPHLLPPEQ